MPLPHISGAGVVTASSGLTTPEAGGQPCLRLEVTSTSYRHVGNGRWEDGDRSVLTLVLFGRQAREALAEFPVGKPIQFEGKHRSSRSEVVRVELAHPLAQPKT